MKKEIIKISTKCPILKVGDIVQFDALVPVKAVKYKGCEKCCYSDLCSDRFRYCDYVCDGLAENEIVMFKELKK